MTEVALLHLGGALLMFVGLRDVLVDCDRWGWLLVFSGVVFLLV